MVVTCKMFTLSFLCLYLTTLPSDHPDQVSKGLCAPVESDEAKVPLREAHSIYQGLGGLRGLGLGLGLSTVNTVKSGRDAASQGERDNPVGLAAAYTGLLLGAGEVCVFQLNVEGCRCRWQGEGANVMLNASYSITVVEPKLRSRLISGVKTS